MRCLYIGAALPGSMESMLTRYTLVSWSSRAPTVWEAMSSNPSLRMRTVAVTSIVAAGDVAELFLSKEPSGLDEARHTGRDLRRRRWWRALRGPEERQGVEVRGDVVVRKSRVLEPRPRTLHPVVLVVLAAAAAGVDIIINSPIVMQRLDEVDRKEWNGMQIIV